MPTNRNAAQLAPALAGKSFATTRQLADAVRAALPRLGKDDSDLTVRRVFQALRIAVNDEFSALETFSAKSAGVPETRRPRGDSHFSFRRGPAREESFCRGLPQRNLFRNFRRSHPPDAGGTAFQSAFRAGQTALGAANQGLKQT